MHFSNIIRKVQLPTGETITASGESVIFSDLLQAVLHDGPRTTVLAFVAVCLVVALIFRTRESFLYIIGTLVFGVLWMGGGIALFDIKINFFNFIAIPTTFGIGVDYGVNIYQRYHLEGKGSIPKVLKTTGGAVALCSLTTIIGYFTLIIAKNKALVSFGWIAIIGELTCLAAALVFIPAFVIYREQKKAAAIAHPLESRSPQSTSLTSL
jgi:predicted RND superfamily exporter protein